LRYTASGQAVSTLRLAVTNQYKSSSGEQKKDTLFIDVVVWTRVAENCCRYLQKGSPVFVEGRLRIREYTPRGEEATGAKRVVTEVTAINVQFLSWAPRDQSGGGVPAESGAPMPEAAPAEQPVEEPYPGFDEEGQ
jgi:single-strand DNA-binding protein